MPAKAGVNGLAVAAIGVGGLMVYAGITGKSVLASVQTLIQGKPLDFTSAGQTHPITGGAQAGAAAAALIPGGATAGNVAGGVALGAAIAQDAMRYDGTGYVFGGDPSKGEHDCSSLVNQVVGADLGLAIPWYPAGKYTGHGHGPTTVEWLTWLGAVNVGSDPALARPGDLCCWQTHMGIAIGGGLMLSARSEKAHPPTGVGNIHGGGPPGQVLFIRRLKVAR